MDADDAALVTFLRARLDEEEQVARQVTAAGGPGPSLWILYDDYRHERDNLVIDPARVLAEVEAKRWIVELHRNRPEQAWDGSALTGDCAECIDEHHPCSTLRLLALPYAAEPGYRAEWAP